MSDDHFVHFVIGSSPFITIYPIIFLYFSYKNLTNVEKDNLKISFETLSVILPVLSGLVFASVFYFLEHFVPIIPRKIQNTYFRFIVAGTISSTLISILLHYGLNIQDKWLKMDEPISSHVMISVFYTFIFSTIGVWLRNRVLYGPQDQAKTQSAVSKIHSPSVPTSKPYPPSLEKQQSFKHLPEIKQRESIFENMKKNTSN